MITDKRAIWDKRRGKSAKNVPFSLKLGQKMYIFLIKKVVFCTYLMYNDHARQCYNADLEIEDEKNCRSFIKGMEE